MKYYNAYEKRYRKMHEIGELWEVREKTNEVIDVINKYKDVLNKIESTLNNIKIDESDLERKKKVHISNILYSLADISSANKIITNNIVLYNKIHYDIYKIIKSMNIDELNEIIKLLNLKNHSTVLITSLDS